MYFWGCYYHQHTPAPLPGWGTIARAATLYLVPVQNYTWRAPLLGTPFGALRPAACPQLRSRFPSGPADQDRKSRPSARCCNAHSRAHACTRKTTRKLLKESCTNRAHLPTPQSGQGFHVAFEKATRPASQGGPYVHPNPTQQGLPPQAPATARSTRKSQRTTPPQPRHGTNGTHAAR